MISAGVIPTIDPIGRISPFPAVPPFWTQPGWFAGGGVSDVPPITFDPLVPPPSFPAPTPPVTPATPTTTETTTTTTATSGPASVPTATGDNAQTNTESAALTALLGLFSSAFATGSPAGQPSTSSGASAPPPVSAAGIDPATGVAYAAEGIDPSTGQPIASAAATSGPPWLTIGVVALSIVGVYFGYKAYMASKARAAA